MSASAQPAPSAPAASPAATSASTTSRPASNLLLVAVPHPTPLPVPVPVRQELDAIEKGKRLAAHHAVNEHIRSGQRVGIGSGSTIVYAVERLAQRYREEKLDIVCVPTSFQANQLIIENGLPLGDLLRYPQLDLTIDGADEVDEQMNLIKGGGGCHLQEKIVAYNSLQLVIICDYRKDSKFLGEKFRRLPIEVVPFSFTPVLHHVRALGGVPTLRMATGNTKAGPIVTDSGNFLIDADFGCIQNPALLNEQLKAIPGVIETGIFLYPMAERVYFGMADGTVQTKLRSSIQPPLHKKWSTNAVPPGREVDLTGKSLSPPASPKTKSAAATSATASSSSSSSSSSGAK